VLASLIDRLSAEEKESCRFCRYWDENLHSGWCDARRSSRTTNRSAGSRACSPDSSSTRNQPRACDNALS
jgi:hypothetical protein